MTNRELLEYSYEYKGCRKCYPHKGYIIEGEEVSFCQCRKLYEDAVFYRYGFLKSGLSEFILDYSIENYKGKDEDKNIDKIKKYIENFETKYKKINLYFYSKENSCQKTTLASYIGNELLKKRYKVFFVLMNDLVKTLLKSDSYDSKDEIITELENYLNCDLLIIDDAFDKSKMNLFKSGYQLSFIDSFLRERIGIKQKATIVTSNKSILEIEKEGFGLSLQEFVHRSFFEMRFKDKITVQNDLSKIFD